MPTRQALEDAAIAAGAVLVDIEELPNFAIRVDIAGRDRGYETHAIESRRPIAVVADIRWRRARWWHHVIAWWRRLRRTTRA